MTVGLNSTQLREICTQTATQKNALWTWRPTCWDFPGGPVAKNPPCNAGGCDLILGLELRSHVPQATKPAETEILYPAPESPRDSTKIPIQPNKFNKIKRSACQGEGSGSDPSITALKENQTCQHLDLILLTLQNCKATSFCCLNHPFCGTLLWQP